jgi:hypothetical protein
VLSILQSSNVARDSFEEKIDQVDGYLRMKGIPSHLREEVKKRLNHQHSNRQFYDKEQVLKLISPDHLRKIREYEALQLAKKVPMLADPANEAFKCALAKRLEQTVAYPDQVIFEERTTSDTMYFISSGLVELYIPSHHDDSYTVIGDGCVSLRSFSSLSRVVSLPHRLWFLYTVLWRSVPFTRYQAYHVR